MTVDMQTQLKSGVVHPVLIGHLEIQNDPISMWTGPGLFAPTGTGDAALDGLIFDSAEGVLDMTDIQEDQSTGRATVITAQGQDLEVELLRQVIRDKRAWLGRPAFIWMGLLINDNSVVANPTRIKTGVMTEMEVRREPDGDVVMVTIDVDTRNAGAPAFRLIDHPRYWDTDTFSTFMAKLSNKGARFTDRDIRVNPTSEQQRNINDAMRQYGGW